MGFAFMACRSALAVLCTLPTNEGWELISSSKCNELGYDTIRTALVYGGVLGSLWTSVLCRFGFKKQLAPVEATIAIKSGTGMDAKPRPPRKGG
jgi:hypothetical protein